MGSAAAVAAGIIPAAIGTQTNGSVIRPAAFCGVVGFKPSAGSISTDGVMTFSRSLDQVGVFAQSVSEAALLASAIAPGRVSQTETRSGPPRLVIAHIPEWQEAQAAARASFDESVASARNAGADVIEKALPPELADALPIHRTIMAAEAHQFIGPLVAHASDLISERLRTLLDEGATTSARDYAGALEMQRRLRTLWTEFIADGDALLTLPALGEAPDLATTGDPRCCTRWTLVGAPAITIPTGFGPSGLPLGVQLVGRVNRDAELISTAAWFESVAGAELQPAQSRRVH
jgi:Asp-tRNA(Asn)/Glu-tRNA(Gln) amidotransferase A subunit family amidase